jgi:cell division inhibitor SepF
VDFDKGREKKTSPEIKILFPKEMQDAAWVCEHLRESKICVINMEKTSERIQAQRIADYLAGASYALNGHIERVNNHIFIMTPGNVKVSHDLKEELKSGKLFGLK